MMKTTLLIALMIICMSALTLCEDVSVKSIKGKLVGINKDDIESGIRLVLNYEQTIYINNDGSFEIFDLSAGTHLLDVISINWVFPQVRIDISGKSGKVRAFQLIPKSSNPVTNEDFTYNRQQIQTNPLKIQPLNKADYFEKREPFNPWVYLKNPMVLTLIVGVGMAYLFPKIVDPEAMKEAQQQMSQGENDLKSLWSGLKGDQPTNANAAKQKKQQ